MKQCPKRKGKNKGQPRDDHDQSMINRLVTLPGADDQPLGSRPIGSITEADLDAALKALRAKERAASTRNKYLTLVRLLSKWGVRKGYLQRPWVTEAADENTDLTREKGAQRHRRVEPDEERRILEHASPWLQRLILAALETACRQGELLELRWADVSLPRLEFTVRDSKSGASRTLPISPKLKAILDMVRNDPKGEPHGPAAFVFGDAIGGQVSSPLTAWENCVLKAYGHVGECRPRKGLNPNKPHKPPRLVVPRDPRTHSLTTAARQAFAAIDLHFHDLRHEAGSRMLEAGWPLHHIQLMLGHADLKQTSIYLNVSKRGLQDSMKRFGTQPLHAVAPEASRSMRQRATSSQRRRRK